MHGIGRGEALELAARAPRWSSTTWAARRAARASDKRAADEVVEVIKARGGEAVANYDDVADFGGAENLIATAYEAFGGHDIVVNNAGIIRDKMIVSMTEDDFDSVLRVHLKGTFAITKFACIRWRERIQGRRGRPGRHRQHRVVGRAAGQRRSGQLRVGQGRHRRADHHHLARGLRATACGPTPSRPAGSPA